MAEGRVAEFFRFIDILKGLTVVPKIIMFVGLVALISGFLSGPFALFQNRQISAGVAIMLFALCWRDWERAFWYEPAPPYKRRWALFRIFRGLLFLCVAVWLFRVCYFTALPNHTK